MDVLSVWNELFLLTNFPVTLLPSVSQALSIRDSCQRSQRFLCRNLSTFHHFRNLSWILCVMWCLVWWGKQEEYPSREEHRFQLCPYITCLSPPSSPLFLFKPHTGINIGTNSLPGTNSGQWRIPIALGLVFAIILGVGILFCPESPRWLAARGRREEALASLAYMRGQKVDDHNEFVQRDYADIISALREQETLPPAGWLACFKVENKSELKLELGLNWFELARGAKEKLDSLLTSFLLFATLASPTQLSIVLFSEEFYKLDNRWQEPITSSILELRSSLLSLSDLSSLRSFLEQSTSSAPSWDFTF